MKKIISFLILACASISLNAQNWISFYVSNSIEVDATTERSSLVLPMKIDSVVWKDVTVKYGAPVYVKLNSKFNKTYLEAFAVSKMDSSRPCILMQVDLLKLRSQGSYEMEIVFSHPKKGDLPLSLTVKRPAATIADIDTVKVYIEGSSVVAQPLRIRETGGASFIYALDIITPSFTGVSAAQSLQFTAPVKISAGKSTEVAYDPKRLDIPPGRLTGKAILSAPELTAPVMVNFEIISRRSGLLIVLMVFLGMLLGAFVRHYLERKKVNEEQKVKALELIDTMNSQSGKIADEDFKTGVAGLIADLEREIAQSGSVMNLQKSGTSGLETKITTTVADFQKLKDAFDQRMIAVKTKWNNFSCLDNYNFTVFLGQELSEVKKLFNLSTTELKDGKPTAAGNNLDNVAVAVARVLNDYVVLVNQLLLALDSGELFPKLVYNKLKAKYDPIIQGIKNDLSQISAATTKECTQLKAADTIQYNFEGLLKQMKADSGTLFENATKGKKVPEDLLLSFKNGFASWSAAIDGLLQNPKFKFDSSLSSNLNTSWEKIESIQSEAQYGDGGNQRSLQPDAGSGLSYEATGQSGTASIDRSATVDPLTVRLTKARKNWLLFAAVQTLFLSLIVGVIAYKYYNPSFIGTWDELTTIFLFAFGLDITVGNVLQLRGSKL